VNTVQHRDIQAIAQLAKLQCGMDLQFAGSKPLVAIESRMHVHACSSYADYLQQLQSKPEELHALIEELVVPETWFFRYPESFEALVEMLPKKHHETLNILSIPCSTGEEPYSIAMRLLMHGMSHQSFQVDATDISAVALQRAESAVYYEHSFRHHELAFRQQYFDTVLDASRQRSSWKLQPHVRQCVHFHRSNILQSNSCLKPKYDIIFCRNLLIYFDKQTQAKVLKRLYAMLNDQGLLFLGHADNAHTYLGEAFSLLNYRAFVWQKGVKKHGIPKPALTRGHAARARHALLQPRHALLNHPRSHPVSRPLSRTRPAPLPEHVPAVLLKPRAEHRTAHTADLDLQQLEKLANQGKLLEAKQGCEAYTSQHPMHAAGWYLLGVILQAENHLEQAKQHFQKALYLEPGHEHSLRQLVGIAEFEGNHDQERRLRQRLQQGK